MKLCISVAPASTCPTDCSHGSRTGSADRGRPLSGQLFGFDANRLRGTAHQVHADDAGRGSRVQDQGQFIYRTLFRTLDLLRDK